MQGRSALVVACLMTIIAASLSLLFLSGGGDGWVKVPRKVYDFDQIPGEEVVITGFLERNDREILAIPDSGEISLITEGDVDQLVAEGLRDAYDFRKEGWTHRIRLEAEEREPNFVIDGARYYVILSTGTDVWNSAELLDDFVGKQVDMIIKWTSFTDSIHPRVRVTQIQAKAVRESMG